LPRTRKCGRSHGGARVGEGEAHPVVAKVLPRAQGGDTTGVKWVERRCGSSQPGGRGGVDACGSVTWMEKCVGEGWSHEGLELEVMASYAAYAQTEK